MAIFLTEALSTAFSQTDGKTLAYFFCDSGFDKRKTATSVVRGLLFQFIQQHPQLLLDHLLPKYRGRGAELFKLFDALRTIFMAVAADQNTGRKYCIIDALDECDQESQRTLLWQLRETFKDRKTPSNARILVTSRPYPEIRQYLNPFANKDLASFPERQQDIDRCIKDRMAQLAEEKAYTEKVRIQVSDILRKKAEGTFLWVGLACEELKDIDSKDAVRVLENMPQGLHSLHKRLLDTALKRKAAKPDDIRRILSCVTVCLRPLSLSELSEACQLHQDEDDDGTRDQFTREHLASCRLMVIIQDGEVLLLHQFVKDFLVGAGTDHFNELEAHAYLAYRCVDLLIEQFRGTHKPHTSFSVYATYNWAYHARMAQSRFKVQDSQAEFFQIDSLCREQWLQRLSTEEDYRVILEKSSILQLRAKWRVLALVAYVSHLVVQELCR
ncbi:hypothetical protein DL98DRAFT_433760 [Cadophora sp. DSE1049]|nr:hypothetical protein DL98DRAFT_433760 [Cadophora sp. DSE1049]